VALFGRGPAGAGGFFDTSVPRTLPPESPAFTGFQDQLAAADLALLNPQLQVASLPPPAAAPSLLRRQPPPRNLLFEPPGMGASDREEEARAEQKRRDEQRAALLGDRLDKATLWSGLKQAEFAGKALPFVFPGAYMADRLLPEGGVKSALNRFLPGMPFEQNRLDQQDWRHALLRNQGFTLSDGVWHETQAQAKGGPGAALDFVLPTSVTPLELVPTPPESPPVRAVVAPPRHMDEAQRMFDNTLDEIDAHFGPGGAF
jgi:hypothetical protein